MATSLAHMGAATPATRDRFVDGLRAFAIVVVVAGHWLLASIGYEDGRPVVQNALALVPGLQWATWAFQVMPLFFVVGGFANRSALLSAERNGTGAGGYIRSRTVRLVAPVVPLGLAWLVAGAVLPVAGMGGSTVTLLTRAMAQPLWFLAVYLCVCALAPLALRLHHRFGAGVVAALAATVAALDAGRLGFGWTGLAHLNYLAVFLAAHQVGFFLGDGRLGRIPRRRLWAVAAGSFGLLWLLTGPGPYPRSMVGVPGEAMSNMSPPTVCILVVGALQVAVVMLVRPAVVRLLQRRTAWTAVVAVNTSIMTVFLWHLTALVLGAAVALACGIPQPPAGTAAWWTTRVPWVCGLAVVLAVVVAVAGGAERRALVRRAASVSTSAAIAGAIVAAAVMAWLALSGFRGWAGVAAVVALVVVGRSRDATTAPAGSPPPAPSA